LAGERLERAASKALLATELALTGAAVAGVPGAAVGGLAGLIVGDQNMTIPVDMVAVPAHEWSAVRAGMAPTMQIYIKAGETILATGGNVDDYEQGVVEAAMVESTETPTKPKRKSAYQRAYAKAFKAEKAKRMTKAGKWKKGGFKAAVKASHAAAKRATGGKS
jgi:hypothetical protein